MPDEPIRQHWVPKVYLRAFCADPSEREQVHVRDLASGASFLTSIDNVAVKKHFYTLGRESETPSYAVESALAELESAVAPALENLRTSEALPTEPNATALLARFLATLHMRTRQGLQFIHGHREEVRSGSAAPETLVPEERARALLALDDEAMRERFARSAVLVGARIGEKLLHMHWRLLRAQSGYFVTSENPVFSFHRSEERWGLQTPGAHTLCPISPTLRLHMSNGPIIPGAGTFDLPASGVHGLNGLILFGANQFLYSHLPLEELAELLEERGVGSCPAFGPAG
jgi:hypothetical protein